MPILSMYSGFCSSIKTVVSFFLIPNTCYICRNSIFSSSRGTMISGEHERFEPIIKISGSPTGLIVVDKNYDKKK